MVGELGIAGKQAYALFLCLDEQQLVKWIFAFERPRKLGSGMTGRQRQQLPIHCRAERDYGGGINNRGPLTVTGTTISERARESHFVDVVVAAHDDHDDALRAARSG